MEDAPKQGEFFEKTEEEKKVVRRVPKYFSRLRRQLEIKAEEKNKQEKESKHREAINEILKK